MRVPIKNDEKSGPALTFLSFDTQVFKLPLDSERAHLGSDNEDSLNSFRFFKEPGFVFHGINIAHQIIAEFAKSCPATKCERQSK
jgi:hypothetical protein